MVSAGAFAWDKRKSKRSNHRIRENTLLMLAFLGPFGAFIAMQVFRHKTQKVKFWLVPFFLILHLGLIIWFAVKLTG